MQDYFLVAFGHGSGTPSAVSPLKAADELKRFIKQGCDSAFGEFPGDLIVSVAPNGVMLAFPDAKPKRAVQLVEAVQAQLEQATKSQKQTIPLSAVITFGSMKSVNVLGYSSNFEGRPAIAAGRILAKLSQGLLAVEMSAWGFETLGRDLGEPQTLAGKHEGEAFSIRIHKRIGFPAALRNEEPKTGEPERLYIVQGENVLISPERKVQKEKQRVGAGEMATRPRQFLTRFVGREKEIEQIRNAVLADCLVTLRGMGGIGKTRLADKVAALVSRAFDDGVFFVELAYTHNSEEAVISELVARLEVKLAESSDEAAGLLMTLENRKLLLVLDNFEAVISAAPFVGRLLKTCPNVHVLITSQVLLGVAGEQQIEVKPMAIPAGQPALTVKSLTDLDGFRLFQDRARLRIPHWEVKPEEAPLVTEIVQLTDGIPLSIELAAAWVDRIALAELHDGLKKKRTEYLKRSGPGIEERRHASIQACIDWSFNLLPREEQALFPKLSVFAEGFFGDDVADVCQFKNAADLLNSLYDHSLLVWEESLGKTRYRMLPTVQEYAVEKLGKRRKQARELRQRHAWHFQRVLEQADGQIRGRKEQMAGINRISADLDNIRHGMETALQLRNHQRVISYSLDFADYLRINTRYVEFLVRTQQGLSAAEGLNDLPPIAGFQNNLAIAYAHSQQETEKKILKRPSLTIKFHYESTRNMTFQWSGP